MERRGLLERLGWHQAEPQGDAWWALEVHGDTDLHGEQRGRRPRRLERHAVTVAPEFAPGQVVHVAAGDVAQPDVESDVRVRQ